MTGDSLVHATCVTRFGRGVLMRGPSGAGKSSLAMQLMAQGWMLVADDYVLLRESQGRLIAAAPESLRGLIEIYGIGIAAAPARLETRVDLVVDLVATHAERLPVPGHEILLGCVVSRLIVPIRHELGLNLVAEALRHAPVSG